MEIFDFGALVLVVVFPNLAHCGLGRNRARLQKFDGCAMPLPALAAGAYSEYKSLESLVLRWGLGGFSRNGLPHRPVCHSPRCFCLQDTFYNPESLARDSGGTPPPVGTFGSRSPPPSQQVSKQLCNGRETTICIARTCPSALS